MEKHQPDPGRLYPVIPPCVKDIVERIDAQAEVSYPDSGVSRVVMTRELLIEALGEAYTRLEAANKVLDTPTVDVQVVKCAQLGRDPVRDMALLVDRSALEEMRARKDAAYLERNQVVAALAKCFPSGVARTAIEGWSEDWHGCVYIDLPTGQVSWHFHDSQAYLFEGLPPYAGEWDGHDTPEKYRRLAELQAASPLALSDAAKAGVNCMSAWPFPQTKPAAWGMTYMGGLMPTVYVVEVDAIKEFERRNHVYPDSAAHRKLVAVYTVPVEAPKFYCVGSYMGERTSYDCLDHAGCAVEGHCQRSGCSRVEKT